MSQCRIVLDTPGVLGAGSTLYGKILCTFTADTIIREIRCRIRGKENTSIRQGKHTYVGRNTFLNLTQTLVGEGTVPIGRYEFRFSFTLPTDIPSSFSGKYGSIYYYIKATVDVPLMFNYKDKICLRVMVPVNFNSMREELQLTPVVYENEKTLCCWCCASEPITLSLFVEKEAFTLGEIANILVEIVNMSNTNVEEFELSLVRVTEYLSEKNGTNHVTIKERVAVEKATGVGAHGRRIYRIDFQIPQTIDLYNFANCYLIKQQFMLMAEAALPGVHQNFSVFASIMLGHIPLLETHGFQQARSGIEVFGRNLQESESPPRYSSLNLYDIEENDTLADSTISDIENS
ncbi:unnamed protein product [Phyllotreta striolata]|uniref:Arrestin C-terminal-like domain-containing protein n=1 Tax=Phyllotreta striolata TaxID=444603 RepID=A0A9P0E0V8_PHYSR|nr:unnamed protein product [Phyllotreta striolata]